MKKVYLLLCLIATLCSCSDSDDLGLDNKKIIGEETYVFERLNFANEQALAEAIESSDISGSSTLTRSAGSRKFISMLDIMPSSTKSIGEEILSYYEVLGYDTLVPNPNFAKLLTPIGELEVGRDVIRITPMGTYKYPVGYEDAFERFIEENPEYIGEQIGDDVYKINENIVLYRTFEENMEDYEIISQGDYEELPDDFFSDDDGLTRSIQTRAVSEPNFNSFQTFSADRKTIVGKLIQNIIGSTKSSTINFSKSRRVKGSFYFYNYGVYGEIGVKGWTDKKNWIGWSKTNCDELWVGWNQVVLKSNIPDYYKQSMKDLQSMVYYPPQYIDVNGKKVNVATLAMPEFKATLKDKVIAQGSKAIHNYLKNELKRPASEWEKAQAFIVATRTELYFIHAPQDLKYKKICELNYVFAQNWMQFMIGWSNKGGFFINQVNQNNANQIGPWLNTITKAFSEKKTTLVGGEVYVCARFGDNWRGMKIVKK
ncbi:MAG: hypothetical protein LUH10_14850 [Tannerellaceae bacterium]|nr:hypothetical protein [Tannerellaceae bacterium]